MTELERKRTATAATPSSVGSVFQTRVRDVLDPSRSIDHVIHAFTTLLAEFLEGAAVHFLLYAEELGDFVLKGSTQNWRSEYGPPRFSAAGTAEFLAIKEKRTVYLQEAQRTSSSVLKAQYFVFPLGVRDPVVGVVTVAYLSERGIDARRVLFAERAVRLAGEFIQRALRDESTARNTLKVSAVSEAGVAIISAESVSNLVQLIVAVTPMIAEAESCVLRLLDEETRKFAVRDVYGIRDDETRKALLHLDRLAAFEVVRTGTPLLIPSLAEAERYREGARFARSLLCHPLMRDDQVIGTVTLFNRIGDGTLYQGYFTKEDLLTTGKLLKLAEKAILKTLAVQQGQELTTLDAATGLANRRAFQKRLLDELSRAQRFKRRLALVICEAHVQPGRTEPAGGQGREQLARRIAEGLTKTIRQYDIVGRMDEHRFGVILPEVENGTGGAVGRIQQRLEKAVQALGVTERVRISFCQATYPDDGEKYEQLVFDNQLF